MRSLFVAVLVTACVFGTVVPLQAQFCFRGKPAPDCSIFFITETGVSTIFSSDSGLLWSAEQAIMFNLNGRWALGGAHYFSNQGQDEAIRGGFKIRVRRWLQPDWSLDFGSGLLVYESGTERSYLDQARQVVVFEEKLPQFFGSVGLSYKDLIILDVGMDYRRMAQEPDKDGAIWHAGLKAGSYIGVGAQLLALAVGIVVLALHVTVGVGN